MNALSVIVVEYHSADEIGTLIDSVRRFEPSMEVIVSSNSCYSDDEVKAFCSKFSGVTFLRNDRNGGYAYGLNCAMRNVSTPFVAVFNPDVEVLGPFSEAAERTFAAYDRLGAFTPFVVDGEGNDTTVAKRNWRPYFALARLLSRKFKGGRLEKAHDFYLRNDWTHDCFQYTDTISGGVMFIRKEAYADVGGADERYFMYMEDADFCRMLWKRGWSVALEPKIKVVHRAHWDSQTGLLNLKKMFSRTRRAHLMSYWRYFWKWGLEHYFPSDEMNAKYVYDK